MDLFELRRTRDYAIKQMQETLLNRLTDLLDLMELAMIEWLQDIESKDEHETWQLYQFCRAIGVFRSCKVLISQGCATDGLALTRTILDILVLTSWVAVDPESRMESVKDQIIKQRMLTARGLRGNVPNWSPVFEDLANRDPKKMQSIPSIQKMANDEHVNLGKFYITIFNMSSAYLHNQGSEMIFYAVEQGDQAVRPNPFPSAENVEIAWLSAYLVMERYWLSFCELFPKPIIFNFDAMNQVASLMNEMYLKKVTWAEEVWSRE